MSQDLPDSLRGRILAYTGDEQANLAARRTALHPASGLVLSTRTPRKLIQPIHGQYQPDALLCDVRSWSSAATVAEPSILPADVDTHEWASSLLGLGASAVLTPSKFVPATDWDVLAAVVEDTRRFTRADVVSLIPTDAAMLDEPHVDRFCDIVRRARRPLAFRFAAQRRPFEKKGRAHALRRLLRAFPGAAIIGVEVLTAVDAMAHGAGMAAIGITSTYRKPFRPGDRGGAFSPDRAPGMFLRDLWETRSPRVYSDWYANSPSPWCDTCDRAVDSFGPDDRNAILEHTLHSWLGVWDDLALLSTAERADCLHDEWGQAFLRHQELTGRAVTADPLLRQLLGPDDPGSPAALPIGR